MLILTRRINESIFIEIDGKVVEVKILGVKGNQVRVGTIADDDVEIHREEIWRRIQAEKKGGNQEEVDGNNRSDYDTRGADY